MRGRPLLRRLTAWAMLGLSCLVASGLPLPLAIPPAPGSAAGRKLAAKDRSRPFPCMDKACGCDSAERCFTNCCCHTPAETLAWARARGIGPAVIAALERRVADADPEPAAGSCCASTDSKPACCETAEPAKPACCAVAEAAGPSDDAICSDYRSLTSQSAATPAPGAATEPTPTDAPAAKVVTLRAMLACGGIVAQWAAAAVSLPPPPMLLCEIPWPRVGTVTLGDERVLGTGGPPDLPPPRA